MKNYENLHTFVVCTYKDSPYLHECLLSLRKQTVKSKVIISTATPTEGLFAIAKEFGVEVVVNEIGGSIGKDWNNGWDVATTKYVTITHQDDIYLPTYAEKAVESLENKDATIFFSNYSEINDYTHIIKRNRNLLIKDVMLAPLLIDKNSARLRKCTLSMGSPICCPAVTYNKERLYDFHFSEELSCALDWEAYTRINKYKGAWVYCSERLVQHRIHVDSATTELIENNKRSKEELEIFRQYWPDSVAVALSKLYAKAQNTNCKK